MRLPMRPTKLAALGALGATGGLVLLFLLFVWLGIHRENSGMDEIHGQVMWIALAVLFIGLIAFHLAMAHQLWHAPPPRDPDAR
jgi:hypothetical protein